MEQVKHIDKQTADGTAQNLDALYQLFPSCFTESADAEGNVKRAIDWGKLRELLGDNVSDGEPEVYDFTWVGKRAAQREAMAPIRKTLRPCPEESVNWDTTQNLYIEGDNLEVLKLLQNSYMGKVKMIYIDPPYNTGNDFVYHDDFHRTQREEDEEAGVFNEEGDRMVKNTVSNGKFHSDWCSMMYSRLMIARHMLTDDGAIFISIDDHEQDNLKKMCDEIYGEPNYIGKISVVNNLKGRNDKKDIATCHEYLLIYGKTEFTANGMPLTEEQRRQFDKVDNKGNQYQLRDLRKRGRPDRREDRPNMFFPIYYNCESLECSLDYHEGWIEILPKRGDGSDGRWRWGKDRVQKNLSILEPRYSNISGRWGIEHRVYLNPSLNPTSEDDEEESEERASKSKSFWIGGELSSDVGRRQLKELFNTPYFDYPKSLDFIINTLYMGADEDSIIMDFFSGSATTAHAIMKLNSEDSGARKYIMIQWPEETDEDSEAYKAGYKNICEIGKERIRRAGKKIKEESPLTTQDLDIGFRVFKCDDSNYKDVAFAPKDYSQESLDLFVDNIKEDRTDLDLLFDCMLRWGVTLDLPMTKTKVEGCTIHNVNEGALVACFDGKVTEAVIDAIAEMYPAKVVFRDSSFEEAAQKMNIFELFKQKCGWDEQEVRNNVRVI